MKNLIIFLLFITSLNAQYLEVTKAVVLAKDSYIDKQNFINKHQNVKAFNALGVTYFVIEDEKNIIITFRGTSNYKNVKTNIDFKDLGFNGHKDVRVHTGFYEVALKAKVQLKNILDKDKNITLIGHSLGGGVALLFGALLYDDNYNIHIYSFGMPAVADEKFGVYYKDLKHDRYAYQYDVVPLMKKSVTQIIGKAVYFIDEVADIELLKNLTNYFESDPYKYIHYGTLHKLDNEVSLDEEAQNENFLKRQILKILLFHSIDTYKKCIYTNSEN